MCVDKFMCFCKRGCHYLLQLFAVVVFGCISSGAWYGRHCQMHGDTNACGYGTGIGVLAFLICIGFLIVDGLFDNLSNAQHRKYAVLADVALSGKKRETGVRVGGVGRGWVRVLHLCGVTLFCSGLKCFKVQSTYPNQPCQVLVWSVRYTTLLVFF